MSSLRIRLLTVLLLALSPAFVLMLLANWKISQNQRIKAEQDARRFAEFVGTQHRESIESARRVLQRVALRPALSETIPGTNSIAKSVSIPTGFANVGMVHRNGRLLQSALPAQGEIQSQTQPWFHRALQSDRFIVENRGIDPASGQPATICALPVHPPGKEIQGVLFASLPSNITTKHPVSSALSESSGIELYNGSGVRLASSLGADSTNRPPVPERLMSALQQAMPSSDWTGDDIQHSAEWVQIIHRIPGPLSGSDTFVVVSLSRAALAAAAADELVFNWFICGAILLLAIALAWLGGDRLLVRRAQALVAATERLANGDLGARTGFNQTRLTDEIDELAMKFDSMAERFQQQEKERAQLEEQVRLAQKMEAIGLLAGGVAHDFNNLLQIISGSTLLADRELPPGSPAQRHLDNVRQASERATKLTRQLLAMTRQQPLDREPTELNELITSILSMIRRTIGAHIEVSLVPEETAAWANADRGQIEQVLLNLCINSRDAMANGGQLELRTRYVTVPSGTHGLRAGDYVEISVRDSGHGIPSEVIPRIFDPFFSTKTQDRGTGLGLSVAYGIMRQHDGHIHVQSEVAFGTTFTLLLPRVPAPRHQPQTANSVNHTARGTELVLVVEDEELVNELTVHVLQEAGYQVLSAKDGMEACELFKAKAPQINMVLMDVIMPRMGGREAAERIRAMRPEVPLLFCSGYSGAALEASQALPRNQSVLSKPYKPTDLLKRVRDALDVRNDPKPA